MDPNQAAAEAAAAAVDPKGETQAALLGKLSGKSPADIMRDRQTHASARTVPGMDMESEFAKKFDQALAAKADTESPAQPASPVPNDARIAVQPPAKVDPLAPPKIGKHGHIRQLKEGIAAKEQSWEAEKAELVQKLQQLEASRPTSDPKLAEILQENERLQRELVLLDITKSPTFASKFEQPRKVTIAQAKNIAGDKGAEVEVVLSMPAGIIRDQKLEELMAELPASTAAIVKAANTKLAEIDFSRQVEIETAKVGLDDHLRQQERLTLLQKQQQEQEFNELLRSWQSDVDALNPAKNKDANRVIESAKQFFDGTNLGPKERAAAALQASLLPVLLEEHNALQSEVTKLRQALSRYESGLPGDGDARNETPNVPSLPQNQEDRLMDFERRLEEKMRRDPTWAGQRRGRLY